MAIILKLTIANIRQKKFRTVLIVLSIVLSVGLMYSILSVSASTAGIFGQKLKKDVGNSELMILPEENSGEQFIPEMDFRNIGGIDYHIPLINAYGYTEIDEEATPVMFTGMSEENYERIYGLDFTQKTQEGLADNQVYIGKEAAGVYKLKLKDHLNITVAGKENDFIITGIIEDQKNNLGYDPGKLELLISEDTLLQLINSDQRVNGYYVKSMPEYDKASFIKELKEAYPDYQVKDVTDLSEFKQIMNMVVTSLFLMVLAVIMVSAFIIYSSFKIIAIERMPMMGTLRSIGATRKLTVKLLLLEALFYGMFGAVAGDVLGVFILRLTMKMLLTGNNLTVEDISYINIQYFAIAFVIGLALSIGSAMMPVIKMCKKSIRSIIFAEIKNEKHSSAVKTIVGIVLIAAAFILFHMAPVKLQLPLDILGTIVVIIGAALIIPVLSLFLTVILSVLLKPIYKDSFSIISANMKNDRTMMNNILLLAMGLGVLLMINNFSTTVSSVVVDVYATGRSDVIIYSNLEDSFVREVSSLDGVDHVYTTNIINDVKANEGKINLMILEGIDGRGYSEYAWNEFGKYLTDDMIEAFTKERSIIITRFTARKYDLSSGDLLKLDFDGNKKDYKIVGIVPSIMNNGNESFIYNKFLQEDSGVRNSQSMYLNISDGADTKKVIQRIKELAPDQLLPVETLKEMQDQNIKSNNVMFYLMKAISIIAMFIGIVGIFNNFTISFLSRRKLYATMRSLGLTKARTIRNMLSEAFFCGLTGTTSGLLLGTILIKAMCYTVEGMGISAEVLFYSIKDYIFVLISGLIISMISAILPAFGITKANIVSGLKYE